MEEEKKMEEFVAVRYSCQRYVDFFIIGGVAIQDATDIVVETEMGEMLGRLIGCRKMMEVAKSQKAQAEGEESKKKYRLLRVASAKDIEDHHNNEELPKRTRSFAKKESPHTIWQ
jgi:hypothetical protein